MPVRYIQSSNVIITRSNIVRYYINNYRNWYRISIRCWIHKSHLITRPNERVMGCFFWIFHYHDVIMGAMASQITSLIIVDSTFIQAQIKENTKAPRHWPLLRGIHRWPVNSPHKWLVMRKMFPFDDVIVCKKIHRVITAPHCNPLWVWTCGMGKSPWSVLVTLLLWW